MSRSRMEIAAVAAALTALLTSSLPATAETIGEVDLVRV